MPPNVYNRHGLGHQRTGKLRCAHYGERCYLLAREDPPPEGGGTKARNEEPRHACGFLWLRRLCSGLSRDTFSPCEKRKRLRGVATARTRPRSPPPKACTLLGGWETHRSLGHAVAGMARRPLAATITRTLTKSSCLICVRSVIPRHVPSTQAFRFRHMVKRDLQ